jgi:hypothetical protein
MKKAIILLVILFLFSVSSFSQVKITTNVGYQKTTGDFTNSYKAGLGVSGGIEYYLQDSNVAISTEVGYNKFTTLINLFGLSPDMDILTFTGGVRDFIKSEGSKIYPYFGAKLGLMSSKIADTGNSSVSSFIWALQAELRFQIAQGGTSIDFNIQYNNSSRNSETISFLGINAGLAFAI